MTQEIKLNNTLKLRRTELGLSQAELAELVSVSRQTIIAIESGEYNPSLLLGFKLAKALRTSITTLFNLQVDE